MNMCPSNKCKTPPELCLRGQVFFIWTNYPILDTVTNKILLLGGKVEQFLSRDVTTILIEDNQLVPSQLLSTYDLSLRSTYAENGTIVTQFPHPNNVSSLPSTSRGYFIASSTSSIKQLYTPCRVLEFAHQWGIQVLGIYQFLTLIEQQFKVVSRQKQRKALEPVSNLSGCFIKFESLHKNYRPCYKMFNNDPDRLLPLKNASIFIKPETFNVILDRPINSRQIHNNHMDTAVKAKVHQGKGINLPVKANDKKIQKNRLKPKEESSYCECCRTHFVDLKQHIKSSRHQNFASNEKNYESLNNILRMLPTPQEFIEKLQNPSGNSDSVLINGDASHCLSVADVPETDYSMPLNLQVRKENIASTVLPINMHIEKNDTLSHNLPVIKDENLPLPLDLHVKKDSDIKSETKEIQQNADLFGKFEQGESHKIEDLSVLQAKVETKDDAVLPDAKINEKQPVETPEESHCNAINGDPLIDSTNTADLAELCLNSFWQNSLPCEIDNIIFDDIFTLDDGKTKLDAECIETFEDSDVAQTPDLVSQIFTPNLRTQTTENVSILMSNAIDDKDCIKTEPPSLQSFPSVCKVEKDFDSVSTQSMTSSSLKETSLVKTPLGDKKQIFSIAAFCADKIVMEATPSCSNALPSKNSEPLFSSESSDDENGSVLISNALNMITNSDSDVKIDKESSEENSVQGQYEVKPLLNCSSSVTNDIKNGGELDDIKKESSLKQDEYVEKSVEMNNSSITRRESNDKLKSVIVDEAKVAVFQSREVLKADKINSSQLNIADINYEENCVQENSYNLSNLKTSPEPSDALSVKQIYSTIIDKQNSLMNCRSTNEVLSCKKETDPESRKENTYKTDEWDLSCNVVNQKYPVSVNRPVEDTKILKERIFHKESLGEVPAVVQSKLPDEMNVSEKCLIPKKNVSLCEMKMKHDTLAQSYISAKKPVSYEERVDRANCGMVATLEKIQFKEEKIRKEGNPEEKASLKSCNLSFSSSNAVSCETKVDKTNCQTFISRKRRYSNEKLEDNSLHRQCGFSETNAKKIIKEQSLSHSVNPCQYSNIKEVYNVGGTSNKLPVESSVNKQTLKIPHKKQSSKLRKLPPLWSVSIMPGSGVKLKFTCRK